MTRNAVVLIIVIIPAIILLGVIIYAVIYNLNANKVLRSGKPNILLDKAPFVNMLAVFGVLILVIIMVFQNYNQNNIIEELTTKVSSLSEQIASLRSENSSLRLEFYNYQEEQKNVYNTNYEIGDFYPEEKETDVIVSFSLREVYKGSIIKIKAINIDNASDTVESIASGAGVYEATLKLSIEANYSLIVIEETDEIIKTNQALSIFLKNRFAQYYKVDILYNDDGKRVLKIYQEKYFLPEQFDITDVKLTLYNAKKEIVFSQNIFDSLIKDDLSYSYLIADNILNDEERYSFKIEIYNQYGKAMEIEEDVYN